MSGYIGNIPVPQATQSREVFTATSGQTTFATVGYPVGFVDVWLNGVKLVAGTDFTATNGSDVVLTVGATTGDTVEVISNSTFEVNSQTFTGTTTLTGDLQATTATFSGAVTGANLTLSGGVYLGGTGAANLLDDYEEGTWTPVVVGTTVAGTGSYNSIVGKYTKIGNRVMFNCWINMTAHTGSGNLAINGLPYTSNSGNNFHNCNVQYSGGISVPALSFAVGMIFNGSSQIALYSVPTGATSVTALALDTAFVLNVSGQYEAQ